MRRVVFPDPPRRLDDGGGSCPLKRQWSSGCLEKKTKIQDPLEKRKKKEYTKEFELTPTPSVVASPSCGSKPPSRPPLPAWWLPLRPWASSFGCRIDPGRRDASALRPEQAARRRSPSRCRLAARDGFGFILVRPVVKGSSEPGAACFAASLATTRLDVVVHSGRPQVGVLQIVLRPVGDESTLRV